MPRWFSYQDLQVIRKETRYRSVVLASHFLAGPEKLVVDSGVTQEKFLRLR